MLRAMFLVLLYALSPLVIIIGMVGVLAGMFYVTDKVVCYFKKDCVPHLDFTRPDESLKNS